LTGLTPEQAGADATGTAAGLVAAYSNTMTTTVNKAGTAWQNPASATNWTRNSSGNEITLTGYTGPNTVVIPDILNGLPVTGFGSVFEGRGITSISGGENITAISASAFEACYSLASVSLRQVTSVGEGAFNLCGSLTAVYFDGNAPAEANDVYVNAPNVTNYVTNPQSTGWGTTWNGRPVVRLPVYADTFQGSASQLTGCPSGAQPLVSGAIITNNANDVTFSNATIYNLSGVLTNGTRFGDGKINGTNGVYWAKNGTNYWILLP
jgi:hypothetical protein